MPSEEERQAFLEYLATKKDMIDKALGHRLMEDRAEEKAALKKAEQDFLRILKERADELTEEEKNELDAECNKALDAELRRNIVIKARQLGRTETTTAFLKDFIEQDLQSKKDMVNRQGFGRHPADGIPDAVCTCGECPVHGKKNS
jgi:hypothetical protein